MKHDISILVSGAGVAGLTAAYWLARHGFRVTVVERAPGLRPGGQALDVRGPALEVARRMGILDSLRAHGTRLTGVSAVDATGAVTFRSEDRSLTGGRFDSPDIEILRDDLCRVLYEAVADRVAFLFDDSITAIDQSRTGVDVTFAHAAPRRFDLVIGADGQYSGVRRLVFGPDQAFFRFVGQHVAIFSVPNFLGLDHWQVIYMDGEIGGLILATDREVDARAYVGFTSPEPLDVDHRDTLAQKRLLADRLSGGGWELPRLLGYMWDAPDFYFYATNQVVMDRWSRGRAVLVGDAGYAVSLATGQGTTVAMVGAYVLAGELATHASALEDGLAGYEAALRDYVERSQEQAFKMAGAASPGEDDEAEHTAPTGDLPDFGQLVQPFTLRTY